MNDIIEANRPAETQSSFGTFENNAVRLAPLMAELSVIEIMVGC